MLGWDVGGSGKVEFMRVEGKDLGRFGGLWCGEFWGKVEMGSVEDLEVFGLGLG